MKIDDRVLEVLSDGESRGEWEIASALYPWHDIALRSKRGAWIRCIVQALWRLERRGAVGYFWVSHGEGVPGDRIWVRHD
jgi:hypothetical protein